MDTVDHEERTAGWLEELCEERADDLLHLLDCVACRNAARRWLRREGEEERQRQPAYDQMLRELEARTPGLLKQMEEAGAEARRLMDRLLGSAADQRHVLAGTPEFRSLKLAEVLLLESWSLQPAEPALSEEMARLAFFVAAQPYEAALAGRVNDVKARSSVLVGNARRLAGDRLGAEECFRRAVACLTCPPDAMERAFYCQMLAALRRDQGRDDEAASLLWRAALVYNDNADLLEEGACLAELGFLSIAEDQFHRAVLPLSRACEVVDLHRDATLAVHVRLGLALCHASLGQEARAVRLLKATRPMYSRVADSPSQMAHVTWMEGRVAVLTGNLEEAPDLLDTARKSFLRQGKLHDAAFASLDLAAALARARPLESIHFLLHDVMESFPASVGQAGVLRALGSVERALAQGRRAELDAVIAAAADMLRLFRRNPLLAFEELPRTGAPAHPRPLDPNG
jgi:tetratricopeptide (TPR) repeat protein